MTPLMKQRTVERYREKLHRLAYQLEHDAATLRPVDESLANTFKQLSSYAGKAARSR